MPNHRLRHSLRLLHRRAHLFQQIQRKVSAIELKREVRGMQILLRRANIVDEAGEEVCFGRQGPRWELRAEDCYACRGEKKDCQRRLKKKKNP